MECLHPRAGMNPRHIFEQTFTFTQDVANWRTIQGNRESKPQLLYFNGLHFTLVVSNAPNSDKFAFDLRLNSKQIRHFFPEPRSIPISFRSSRDEASLWENGLLTATYRLVEVNSVPNSITDTMSICLQLQMPSDELLPWQAEAEQESKDEDEQ